MRLNEGNKEKFEMMRLRKTIIGSVYLLFLCSYVQSSEGDAELRGKHIAQEADRRVSGYIDSEESFTMTLTDKKGKERVRTLRIKSLERSDDGDWGLTIFDKPSDVKGTAFLSYSHGLDPDDQWIYLPALKRVKRISSKNRSGPFMGSEFAFEDMSDFAIEKYSYRYLREESCGELRCFVSEWKPLYEHSGYFRLEVWHDTEEYRVHKTEFYDRQDRHLKTMKMSEYKLYGERFWRAEKLQIHNHRSGKGTSLQYDSIQLGVGLTERDFDRSALKRAR